MHLHIALIAAGFTVPPAVKSLAVLGFVFGIIQILKMSSVLAPYIRGWVAIALNAFLSLLGLLVAIPPDQLYSLSTLGVTLTTWLSIVLGAAGIKGTVTSLSAPTVLAEVPVGDGKAVIQKVPAVLVPIDPAHKPIDQTAVKVLAGK